MNIIQMMKMYQMRKNNIHIVTVVFAVSVIDIMLQITTLKNMLKSTP